MVANLSSLPVTGETGKMYVTVDNNKVFRWSGSTYIQIVASPGSTDEVSEGSVNKYFTDSRAIAALASALSGKANTVHTHTTSDITNLGSYTGLDVRYYTETEVDSLLSGKANSSHTHSTSDITSGTFNTARLGTGTANSSTYLRGDGTWATVSAGIAGSGSTNRIAKLTSSSTIGDSQFYDDGLYAAIGGAPTSGVKFSITFMGAESFEFLPGFMGFNFIQHYNRSTSTFMTSKVSALTHEFQTSGTTRFQIKASGVVNVSNAPIYPDNTAALAGGLVSGDVYKTPAGDLKIVF